MDKPPWLNVDAPAGPVEAAFLRPLLLGEGIAPFRIIDTALAVVPVVEGQILDSAAAAQSGHRFLAAWLRQTEAQWGEHASRNANGNLRMTLSERINHMRGLSLQAGVTGPRVVYTKAGTLLSAAIVEDDAFVIDHKAYWAAVESLDEARYLATLVNSRTVLDRVVPMQPRGWRDPRDFDKLVWELPIPEFAAGNALHAALAAVGQEAEAVAASVELPTGDYRRKRRAIRDALAAAGLAARMETLVARLLDG